jgi:hypothetical protein
VVHRATEIGVFFTELCGLSNNHMGAVSFQLSLGFFHELHMYQLDIWSFVNDPLVENASPCIVMSLSCEELIEHSFSDNSEKLVG